MKVIAIAAVLAGACSSAVIQPKPPHEASCADACAHLRALGCESGELTDDGASCEDVCENLEAANLPGARWPVSCVLGAESCSAADRCH